MTAGALGCTKGTPNFSDLGNADLPQPIFNGGSTEQSLTANTASQTFAISGTCDPKIRDITGFAVGTNSAFATLQAMSTGTVNVQCSTQGTFSFTLKSLTDLGYTPVNGQICDIQLRAVTKAGISNPSTIHITFSTTGGADPKHLMITSGGTAGFSTGGNFKARIRVTNKIVGYADSSVQDAMTLKAGTHFQMRTGFAAQGD
jgi:hypothetical protein